MSTLDRRTRQHLSLALAFARDPHRPDRVVIPWRVVLHGRRFVDLEDGPAPRFFDIYNDQARAQRAAVEEAIAQMAALLTPRQFWTALRPVRPIEPAVRDLGEALTFTARDALDLFIGVIVSGMPFGPTEPVLERMAAVLRPVFPDSPDPCEEDLCDAERVSPEVLEALDQVLAVRGIATPYLTCTTLLLATYSFGRAHRALSAAVAPG